MIAHHDLIRIVAVHPEGLPSLLYVKDAPRKRSKWDGTPNNNWRWIATYDMFGTCPIDGPLYRELPVKVS